MGESLLCFPVLLASTPSIESSLLNSMISELFHYDRPRLSIQILRYMLRYLSLLPIHLYMSLSDTNFAYLSGISSTTKTSSYLYDPGVLPP